MRGIWHGRAGEGNLPPFWIQGEESSVDPRVVTKSRELWPWAYHHVRLVLHDAERAAELFEEVAIKVSERLREEPEVNRNLKGYLIRAFRNRIGLELLRASRITYEGLVSELEGKHRLAAPNGFHSIEVRICVDQIIPLMPPDARRIVSYRLLDYEWGDIAAAMDLEVVQVKNKYHYGIRAAWECLVRKEGANNRRTRKRHDETEVD